MSLIVLLSGIAAWCQTTASVSVNAGSTMAQVGPEAYGVDTAVYDGYLTSSGVSTLLTQAGINAVRYPGGSYADIFNFFSGTDNTVQPGAYFAAGDEFNFFMSDTVLPEGGKALITVNYGSNLTNNGGGQPSEAASWVQYANVTNNYGIVYWEIGNEVYGNGYYSTGLDWEEDLHDTDTTPADRVGNAALSPTAYGTNAAAFIKAMKAVDPNIKCGVFVNTASYYTNWDQDVLSAVSSALNGSGYSLDFVIVHWYPGGSDAQILASQYGEYGIANTVSQIRSDIKNYYKLGNANDLEIIITESGAGSVGGIMPALFATDDDLTWFENSATNVEYQELHNGFLTDAGPGVPEGPWYGTQFASTLARPEDTMVSTTSSNALLRTHAVKRTDGKLAIILINDDPNNSTTATVSVSGATIGSSGTEYSLGTANFNGQATSSTGVEESTINGLG
ncbi:MAG TPA: cellulase family glycosylhydrolase, partial [Terracidiphilus sp.]